MSIFKTGRILGKNSFCGLDIGSYKFTIAYGVFDPLREGIGDIAVESVPAKGIFKGVVNDIGLFSETIKQAVKKIEGRSENRISRFALSINGNYIQARHSIAALALAEHGMRCITKRDIERLNQQARTLGLELDEYLLHEFPQGYSVDRHNMTLNPLGLHGRRLQEDLLLVCANVSHVENIIRAAGQAGCDVEMCVYSGVAAAEAVLGQDEKDKGCVLVDIGDTLTGIVVYKEGVARHVSILSFGGRNISDIMSNFCALPLDAAEELKKNSLELVCEEGGADEVLIKTNDAYRSVKKCELVSVITPETERFLEMLKSRIAESGIEQVSSFNVVVVGGSSLLEGLLERMEKVLSMPVRLGLPKSLSQSSMPQAPMYASAVGLLEMQLQEHMRTNFLAQAQDKAPWRKLSDYLSDLYKDYF